MTAARLQAPPGGDLPMRRRLTFASSLLLGIALSLASTAIALADVHGGPFPK